MKSKLRILGTWNYGTSHYNHGSFRYRDITITKTFEQILKCNWLHSVNIHVFKKHRLCNCHHLFEFVSKMLYDACIWKLYCDSTIAVISLNFHLNYWIKVNSISRAGNFQYLCSVLIVNKSRSLDPRGWKIFFSFNNHFLEIDECRKKKSVVIKYRFLSVFAYFVENCFSPKKYTIAQVWELKSIKLKFQNDILLKWT